MARRRIAEEPMSQTAVWSRRLALFALVATILSIIIVRSGLLEIKPALVTFAGALAFAAASMTDIFGADKLAAVTKLTATELASGVFLQQKDGTFRFAALPRAAQVAPINAIVARDLDGDGQLDLLCVGNDFSPEPTTGRFDGGVGVFLKGDGKGNFNGVLPAQSGVLVLGDARSAVAVDAGGKPAVVVSRCDGPLLLFERK